MFLLILESIGTSELILIGIIALIFLGPRKLPQIARTIGKTMADLRSTTNDFKETWRREVDFEEEIGAIRNLDIDDPQPSTVPRDDIRHETGNTIALPEIKPAQADLFAEVDVPQQIPEPAENKAPENDLSDKRNWL
jgi:Tat protein translocase TatB subunit